MPSTSKQKWRLIGTKQRAGTGYHIQFEALPMIDRVLPIACEWSPKIPCAGDRRDKINMQIYENELAKFVHLAEQALGDALEVS